MRHFVLVSLPHPVSTADDSVHDDLLATRRQVLAAASVMILAQLAFRAWAISGSWYRFDDANFMSKLMSDGLSADLLFHGFAGHLMPGAFALTAYNFGLDPYAWAYPAIELLVLQAVANLGALVFLCSAFGVRRGILPPLALFLFSSISLPAFLTWGPGITQLPFLAAIFWGAWAHLNYLRTRRFGWALLAMLITLAAIAFGEKAMLLFWPYAVLALGWFATGDILARMRTLFTTYLPGVILYGIVSLGSVAAYLFLGASSSKASGTTDANGFAMVAQRFLFESWAPGAVGGPLRWTWLEGNSAGWSEPGAVVSVLAVVALALLTYELGRTRSIPLRAWWLVGGILVIDIGLITGIRAGGVGPDIALAYRYLTDTIAVTAMALALATLPLRGAVETLAPTRTSAFLDVPKRVAVVTAIVAGLGLFSSFSYAQGWHEDDNTRRYIDTVQADLADVDEPLPMADGPVPEWMVWGASHPYNQVSRVLRPLADKMEFPRASTDHLYLVDEDGHIRPAAVDPERRAIGAVAASQSRDKCTMRIRQTPLQVALDGGVDGAGWWVRVSYVAGADDAGRMRVTAGDHSYDVDIRPGFRSLYLRTGEGRFDTLEFQSLTPGSKPCLGGVEIGNVVPFGDPISGPEAEE
ncbi:hypothetical protein GCM10017579_10600 [Nocardioides luteus]|uniref:Glycosyltransferase RgtA/B/C/D-like domain-containing protein n=1 Tax=Nocardioides luteus TaxID=1844 RepID=A0ABQ5ST98_9ACTN|nr:hypothetical protein GCM10017579_10600 [Nocardioides luteus]